jgi:hypothetical protein
MQGCKPLRLIMNKKMINKHGIRDETNSTNLDCPKMILDAADEIGPSKRHFKKKAR